VYDAEDASLEATLVKAMIFFLSDAKSNDFDEGIR
jgi:hypothetical protein